MKLKGTEIEVAIHIKIKTVKWNCSWNWHGNCQWSLFIQWSNLILP